MSSSPAGSTPEPAPYIRARAGGEVDGRRVGRWILVLCVLALAGVVLATTIGAAHQNSSQTKLQRRGVPVEVTVVGCISYGSGIGQGVTYWACRGSYTLDGRTYPREPIGGNRAFQPAGRKLHAFAVPGDPGLISTAAVSRSFSRWTPYITPIILAAVTVALALGLVLWPRRRRSRPTPIPLPPAAGRDIVASGPTSENPHRAATVVAGSDITGAGVTGSEVIGSDVTASSSAGSGSHPETSCRRTAFLQLAAIVVDDYDVAIAFFVDALGFELAEDTPSVTREGMSKRWVVVRPPGAETGILLARAEGDERSTVGRQTAGRVGFFLQVEDFDAAYLRLQNAGAEFVTAPHTEAYGRVVVFIDVAGNRWDLLGPA